MYSGNISVDIIMLSEILSQLKTAADETEQICSGIKTEQGRLTGMSLEKDLTELDRCKRSAEIITDEIFLLCDKLKKIIHLYSDTEEMQLKMIRELPGTEMFLTDAPYSSDITGGKGNAGYFSGNYIINEEWLNEIPFDF